MTTPTTRSDPEGDKRRALKYAARTVAKAEATQRESDVAIRFASEAGASLREIAAATGVPFNTVKRIIDRQAAEA